MMLPGQATHAPMHGAPPPSPLVALLAAHAAQLGHGAPMQHPGGMQPQAAGAPMALGAGGHAAPKFGHAPQVMPGM